MYITNLLLTLAIIPIFVIATMGRTSKNGYKTIGISIVITTLVLTISFGVLSALGMPLGVVIEKKINEVAMVASQSDQIISMLGLSSMTKEQRMGELIDIYKLAANAIPALLIISTTIVAYFEYMIISGITFNKNKIIKPLEPIKDLKFPEGTMWGAILIYLATYAVNWINIPGSEVLEINGRILFQFLFQIQGIAVLFFFAHIKKWNNIIGVLLSLIFLATFIGQMLLSFLGFFEMGFGVRKVFERKLKK